VGSGGLRNQGGSLLRGNTTLGLLFKSHALVKHNRNDRRVSTLSQDWGGATEALACSLSTLLWWPVKAEEWRL